MAGKFFWYELLTTDTDAAVDFYGHVAGWTAADFPGGGGDGSRYTILSAGGRGVAGVFQLTADMRAEGARPGWLGYVEADDVDAKAREVEAAGGSIRLQPWDLPGVGRIAMVADPGGAPFYLMAPRPPEGAPPPPDLPAGTPGGFAWHELYAGQGEKAAFDFYSRLFGWETVHEMDMGPMGIYRLFGLDGQQLGGMMDKPANLPAPAWGFYVTVEEIEAAAARVREKGGQVLMGPHEVPGGGWIVQGLDPQGAAFALTTAVR